jgi:hypothetical protein
MKTLSKAAFTAVVSIGLLSVALTTARADDWNDHQRQAHDWHQKHMHHHHHPHGPVIVEPNVVYAPPVVIEPPPPPEDSSGLNIVIPINIR